MPISGLTNPSKSFLKIGQIRKGMMEEKTGQNGSKYTAPVDLDYFRVTFRPDEAECAAEFLRVYGPKPTRINIRFPFRSIAEVWDANYECYSQGGLIAKAGSTEDGKAYWIFYRDYATGEIWVRNGSPVGQDGIRFFEKPVDVALPVYTYKDKKGNEKNAFLEPVGRLQVVVPELAHLRVGYLEFRPGSPKDILALSRELAAIDMLAQQAGKDISGIPMVLSRREEMITKNIKGKLSQGESWLVHIEVTGIWGQKALTVLERNSSPDVVEGEAKELPYDEDWDGEEFKPSPIKPALLPRGGSAPELETVTGTNFPPEPEEPEYEEDFMQNPPSTPPAEKAAAVPEKPATTPENAHQKAPEAIPGDTRPYSPISLKRHFEELADAICAKLGTDGKEITVTEREVKVVASLLTTTLAGNKMARYEFCEWLTGTKSVSDMSACQVKALKRLMGIKVENAAGDFEQAPSAESIKEITDAHKFCLSMRDGRAKEAPAK